MKRSHHRQALATLSAAALLLLLALPAAAIDIPEGDDTWNTPGGGGTEFKIPGADLDSLCGVGGNPNTTVVLKGKNIAGQGNGDIVIHRNADIDFDESATGPQTVTIQIQATDMHFVNKDPAPSTCACDDLDFDVTLDGAQPETDMTVTLDADGLGGDFDADIALNVKWEASCADGSSLVFQPLTYSPTLPNPAGGTPWGYTAPPNPFNPNAPWHPGVTKAGDRVNINRIYLDPDFEAKHLYKPPTPGPGGCRTETLVEGRTVISIRPCPIDIEPIDIEPIGTLLN